MAIKNMSQNSMKQFAAEIEDRYARKSQLGTLASKNKVAKTDLEEALKTELEGKADAATTLAGYGITDGMTATEIASAIATAISGADHLSRVKVDSVDEIDVSADGADKKIYMVAKSDVEEGSSDKYDEYMVINGALERVGDWKVDLSDYATTAAVATAITNALKTYSTTEEMNQAITTAIAGVITLRSLSAETVGTGNVVTRVEYDESTGKTTATKGMTALQESDIGEYTEAEIKGIWTELDAATATE